jgi:hypothetical protein
MPGPVLYSANPWFATNIAHKYRNGIHLPGYVNVTMLELQLADLPLQ